ncbi:glycosyltransferase [Labilibaculum sp. A4]|uniref:glycosyltransferase family 2 protein n=1 Tax=Labilibaculum euxinus TaxID=2686357 RepID=UPI000F627CFF|nr:glycosyltransferase family 2 protein [Labilibaculum euxinus]MDQ1769332.1 glycosyltransferase family 2 protein [Labilibaculum euxinus]MWN74857.1 glycosyltransferase [Labilibaculum euxinus]
MKKLSLVICVYNEEQNIAPLHEQIIKALSGYEYEAIFVDDGSTDKTRKNILQIKDDRFILVQLRKNYGQSSALAAGILVATGEYIVTLDGDLQNDPSDIPMMLDLAESEDWDLVAGIRNKRKDGLFLRLIPSKIANYLIRLFTRINIKDYGCTLKVYKNEIAKELGLYGELHRFIPILASANGASITQVSVKHHSRIHGKTKYNILRTFKVISDLILMVFLTRYMQKPMHIFGGIGILIFSIGALINIYLLVLKVMGQDIWGKPILILGLLLVVGGIQLVTIGIISEIQMRTYYEAQQKKPFKIRSVISCTNKEMLNERS